MDGKNISQTFDPNTGKSVASSVSSASTYDAGYHNKIDMIDSLSMAGADTNSTPASLAVRKILSNTGKIAVGATTRGTGAAVKKAATKVSETFTKLETKTISNKSASSAYQIGLAAKKGPR